MRLARPDFLNIQCTVADVSNRLIGGRGRGVTTEIYDLGEGREERRIEVNLYLLNTNSYYRAMKGIRNYFFDT